jgi:two-component system nitrate/nitrite response regulator NarL
MIRVLITSPVRLIADLLDTVLKNQADLQVVGYVTNADEALRRKSECDLILASATLPTDEMNLLLASLRPPKKKPRLVIFGAPNLELASLHYLESGAAGCVRMEDSIEKLLSVVRATQEGIALSPQLSRLVVNRINELTEKCRNVESRAQGESTKHTLTAREKQVLDLIAQGYGNHEIAKQLTIQVGTTKNHVHNILDKLKVSKRKDAVAYWSLGLNHL